MMNYYERSSETKGGIVFTVMQVSQKYIDCKKEVEKITLSIRKLIASTKNVLEKVNSVGTSEQIQNQYKYCLKHTISFALDDVDRLIEEYNVTDDEEVKDLREKVINLLDDVEALFNKD